MFIGTGEPIPGSGIERPAVLVYMTIGDVRALAAGLPITVPAPDIKALAELKGWPLGAFDVVFQLGGATDRDIATGIVERRAVDGHAETNFHFHSADGPPL